jgi:molybdopterin converting factor small subunit
MIVRIPSPLRSYTAGKSQVEAAGCTVSEVLADLDNSYPGIKFRMIDEQGRIREHIKIFVNTDAVASLDEAAAQKDTVHIICALSGG